MEYEEMENFFAIFNRGEFWYNKGRIGSSIKIEIKTSLEVFNTK